MLAPVPSSHGQQFPWQKSPLGPRKCLKLILVPPARVTPDVLGLHRLS